MNFLYSLYAFVAAQIRRTKEKLMSLIPPTPRTDEEFVAAIIEATKPRDEKKDHSITEKGRKLGELARRIGGCQTEHLIALVEELSGEKLPPAEKKTEKYVKYMALVPLKNPNSHTYPLGRVCVCTKDGSDIFVRENGTTGNHFPDLDHEDVVYRRATEEEIRAYVAGLPKYKFGE